MQKFYVILIISLFLLNSIFASNELKILDPQSWWSEEQGTIEEVLISVKPKGIYTEYGLYLTISARETYFHSETQLEVKLDFELPENAIVTDSWLWIEDEIVRAIIMDKWTASALYEDIVDRQKDPSILFKQSPTQYQLRIYPMFKNEPRKVKITYMVPTNWDKENIKASLPVNLLKTSRIPPEKIDLITSAAEEWQNPKILEIPDVEFMEVEDSLRAGYLHAEIPFGAGTTALTLAYNSLLKNNIFLSTYKNEGENYYQLAILPPGLPEISGGNEKILFLIDNADSRTSSASKEEIISGVRNFITDNLAATDSFNIFLGNINNKKASDNWMAADSVNLENIFSDFLMPDNISNYSNLVALLNEGVEFLNSDSSESNMQMILISNSFENGELNAANDIIKDLLNIYDPIHPVHTLDIYNGSRGYWNSDRNFYGNEYLYENISRLTKGEHYSTRYDGSFNSILAELSASIKPKYSSLDIHTKLQNGFCYNRFSVNYGVSTSVDDAILQSGKFKGEFPFIIETSAIYDTNYYFHQFEITEEAVYDTDSSSELIWTGNMIQGLENSGESNSTINEIIYHSVNARILSKYTAFICLEPSQGGEVCYDCYDENDLIISVEDEEGEDDSVFTAYPNPFNMETQIVVKLSKNFDMNNLSFKIFNILGEQVKSFQFDDAQENRFFKFNWNGKNDYGETVSSGVYIFTVTSATERQTLKLLLMK